MGNPREGQPAAKRRSKRRLTAEDGAPVSLHPLTFEEALSGLLAVKPDDVSDADDTDEEEVDVGEGS